MSNKETECSNIALFRLDNSELDFARFSDVQNTKKVYMKGIVIHSVLCFDLSGIYNEGSPYCVVG